MCSSDLPRITRGPYRFLSHPNYAIVIAEIAVAPLIFGAWGLALAFSALNLALIGHRIGQENAALDAEEDRRQARDL